MVRPILSNSIVLSPYAAESPTQWRASRPWDASHRTFSNRSAHQLLTDPSHGSVHYRPNIRLVNSDGVGTRGDAAISGDGIHFGGISMHTVADRFLTEYNNVFGTNLTIPSLWSQYYSYQSHWLIGAIWGTVDSYSIQCIRSRSSANTNTEPRITCIVRSLNKVCIQGLDCFLNHH